MNNTAERPEPSPSIGADATDGRTGAALDAEPAIAARGLTKHYGSVVAVDSLDLTVWPGEVYGFIGRNGAGKTTTIRMLLGLVAPTDGDVRIHGDPLTPGAVDWLNQVGSLVEATAAYPNLTVAENLELHRRLTRTTRARVAELVEQLSWRRWSAGATPTCRWGTGSGSASPRPCCVTRPCSSSMSPPTASTRPGSSNSDNSSGRWPTERG